MVFIFLLLNSFIHLQINFINSCKTITKHTLNIKTSLFYERRYSDYTTPSRVY
ncbi:hypothetical protein Pf1_00856 [Flavobacterium columnare]|nr:hypothetical protein Pf1_00856 [Flavobacterium columnare]